MNLCYFCAARLQTGCAARHSASARATAAMSGTHTIVLIQQNSSKKSCAYYDRDSVDEAMDGARRRCRSSDGARALTRARWAEIVKRYEEKLKQLNPTMKNITYDIADLFTYIDTLHDLSCLVCVLARSPPWCWLPRTR